MAGGAAPGGFPGRVSFVLSFDLDQLTLAAGAAGLSSSLPQLIKQSPAGTQAAGAWLPDLDLTQAEALLNLSTGDVGAYAAVADAEGNQLASAFVYVKPAASPVAAAAGVSLDASVDLAATPLFGALLSGVTIGGLGVSYASQEFAAGDIELPSGPDGGIQAYQRVPAGFGLRVTVTAGGSSQAFSLGDGPGTGSGTGPGPSALVSGAADSAAGPAVTWFAVQKSIGPLSVDRVGVVTASGTLGLAIDASVSTDVVDIDLTGFTVSFTPSAMTASPPAVSLDGLAVAVDAGELQIAGVLTRTQAAGGVEYDGALVIGIGPYAIDTAGSYTVAEGAPSLFVFGVAKGEFGGPPAFSSPGWRPGSG